MERAQEPRIRPTASSVTQRSEPFIRRLIVAIWAPAQSDRTLPTDTRALIRFWGPRKADQDPSPNAESRRSLEPRGLGRNHDSAAWLNEAPIDSGESDS